jgi:hypothetical protein
LAQGASWWFAKVLDAKTRAGKPVNIAELARETRIDRTILQRLKSGRIQSTSQEYIDRIAKTLEVPAPRVGGVVARGGVSAAAMATLASVRADLEAAIEQLLAVERELTSGGADDDLAGGAGKRKRKVDAVLPPGEGQKGTGGG